MRFYVDDWGVISGTAGTEYVIGLTEHIEAATHIRAYYQDAATFYEDIYPSRREFMTADRELSRFYDVFGGGRLAYRSAPVAFLEDVRAEIKVVGFRFVFFNFSRLPDRNGVVVDLALGARF